MYNFTSNLEYNKLSDTRNQINFEWRKDCSADTEHNSGLIETVYPES